MVNILPFGLPLLGMAPIRSLDTRSCRRRLLSVLLQRLLIVNFSGNVNGCGYLAWSC